MTGDRVYLTFDDGPDEEWTPRVLDIRAAAQIAATFFAVGANARRLPHLVRRVVAEGHAIGNHTFSHRHPWTMLPARAREEVAAGAAAIADIVGAAPRFYRPPHGRLRRCMIDQAERTGQSVVLWDRSAVDWGPLGSVNGIHERLSAVGAGEIVLMHDGRNKHNRPDQLTQVL